MSAPLAHLYALALRTLDAHERRTGDLRARIAPVLAAGGVGTTLLAAPAAGAIADGGVLCAVVLVVTAAGAVVTAAAAGRVLVADTHHSDLDALTLGRGFASAGVLLDEAAFYTAMIAAVTTAARRSEAEFVGLQRQFTAVMCGILFVLCGLATAVLVA